MSFQMLAAKFHDQITGSNSSGAQKICHGEFVVYCDAIPDDAPQDWAMGPKLVPGEFGIFAEHLFYPRRHGPYALATAKTQNDAMDKAAGFFKRCATCGKSTGGMSGVPTCFGCWEKAA